MLILFGLYPLFIDFSLNFLHSLYARYEPINCFSLVSDLSDQHFSWLWVHRWDFPRKFLTKSSLYDGAIIDHGHWHMLICNKGKNATGGREWSPCLKRWLLRLTRISRNDRNGLKLVILLIVICLCCSCVIEIWWLVVMKACFARWVRILVTKLLL